MFYELYERAGKKYQFICPKEANAGCCIVLVYPQGPAVSDPSFYAIELTALIGTHGGILWRPYLIYGKRTTYPSNSYAVIEYACLL